MSNMTQRSSAAVSEKAQGYDVPSWVSLRGTNFSGMSAEDRIKLVKQILDQGIHGISFSPYREMYRHAVKAGNGKKVIIIETGWPSSGTASGAAQPSFENAMEYFVNTYQWAAEEGIETFYFSSFDESCKVGAEGDVGAYWGLWDKDGNLKYV